MGNAKVSTTRHSVRALSLRPSADVLIIGAGINGIALFRDLAAQGIDVALVERGDFVSGASSASSHMIHGGIRYLENGEFRLVKESVTERNRLLRNAPHYVRPLKTTIPIFSTVSGIFSAPARLLISHGRGKPNERGALLVKIGLIIYDTFSRDGGQVPRHRVIGRKRSLAEFPHMNDGVKYTASYFDASMHDPERLALDVLRDGLRDGQPDGQAAAGIASSAEARSRAVNYVAAVGMTAEGVRLRDHETKQEFDFTAQVVVNTSGPQTDLTNTDLGQPSEFMGGTKGSHVVLNNPELMAATGGNEIFFEHSDGRIVLIYPLKDRVLVGTTDSNADPREQQLCTDAEIDYFFELIRHVFPNVSVQRSDIVYTFSGIRPLPKHDDTAPGFVSRDYRIEEGSRFGVPVLSLVGGKWTTFRALAEHLANDVLEKLGVERANSTETLEIGGGVKFPRTDAAKRVWIADHADGRDRAMVSVMLERYGTYAAEVLAEMPENETELTHVPGYFASELSYLARSEQVIHLDDLLRRRTSLVFVGGVTRAALEQIAVVVAEAVGWDDARRDAEVQRFAESMRSQHRIDIDSGSLV